MKFFGHANLMQNELQQAVIPLENAFPAAPKAGQLAFVNKILYICVEITDGLPIWVPLTRELTLYTHAQDVAASTWTINHDLNTTAVQVQVFGVDDHYIAPTDIVVANASSITVTFGSAVSGRAIVLTGHNDGNPKPTYSYIHYQTVSSNSWVVNHGLGREPITRVFVGNQEVQPQSITHTTLNSLTVAFSQPYVGIVKLV
jgi:hypothetical protein